MRNKSKALTALKSNWIIVATVWVLFMTLSCSKSSSSDNNTNPYPGTYYGSFINSTSTYNEPDTITIPATTSSSITMSSKTSLGSTYSINGTVSGTNLTIPSQSVYIANLGATYTVSGMGTLNNGMLIINYVFVSATNVQSNWKFTGTKQ